MNSYIKAMLKIVVLFISMSVFAEKVEEYEMKKLFEPSEVQLIKEAHGSIIIYDGIPDAEVDRAMDEHYHRIDNMMFTRIKYNNTDSKNSEMDDVEDIDDGC